MAHPQRVKERARQLRAERRPRLGPSAIADLLAAEFPNLYPAGISPETVRVWIADMKEPADQPWDIGRADPADVEDFAPLFRQIAESAREAGTDPAAAWPREDEVRWMLQVRRLAPAKDLSDVVAQGRYAATLEAEGDGGAELRRLVTTWLLDATEDGGMPQVEMDGWAADGWSAGTASMRYRPSATMTGGPAIPEANPYTYNPERGR